MAPSCIISEIKRDIGRNRDFFSHTLAFNAPVGGGGSQSQYCHTIWYEKLGWLPDGEKSLRICLAVLTEYRRVTNRQTDTLRQHSPHMRSIARLLLFVTSDWPMTGFYRATRMHSAYYAVARCLSVRPSVCPSLCPSHAGILSKLLNISSNFIHQRVA